MTTKQENKRMPLFRVYFAFGGTFYTLRSTIPTMRLFAVRSVFSRFLCFFIQSLIYVVKTLAIA